MKEISIRDEYIKLEQVLKLSVEYQRGKKLRENDTFTYDGHDYKIVGAK